MNLTVERCESENRFLGLREEWSRLLERSRSQSVFLTWEWQYAWWRCLSGAAVLGILTVRDSGGSLLGIAPLFRQGRGRWPPERVLAFIGTERVSSEYLDFITEPTLEREVTSALLDTLLEDPTWDLLRLSEVRESSIVMTYGREEAERRGAPVSVEPGQVCPYIALPETPDEFRSSLSHKTRGNLRRLTRKLDEAGSIIVVTERPEDVPEALETLYRLHAERWRFGGQSGNFSDPKVRAFHNLVNRELAHQGRVRLYSLRWNERTIAILYALEYNATFYFYQSGFDPAPAGLNLKPTDYSPGFVLIGHSIQDSIRRGLREFDFLRGAEDYKSRWAKTARDTFCLSLVPPGRALPWARQRIRRSVRAAKTVVKRVLLPDARRKWHDR